MNRLAALLVGCVLFCRPVVAQTSAGAPAPPETEQTASKKAHDNVTLIQAGWVLAIPGTAPQRERTIVVRNGRIERIDAGYIGATEISDSDVTVVDLRHSFVLPGLMDMHVHLDTPSPDATPFRLTSRASDLGATPMAQREDVSRLVEAIGNARSTLMAGYTTVRDLGSDGWSVIALRDAIAGGQIEGPRVIAAGTIIRPGGGEGEGACSGVEDCRRVTRRQIDMGADLIKIYATCSGSMPCGLQFAPPTFLDDELKAIIDTAHSRQLRVAAHAHGEEGIRAALRAGVDSIEHGSYTPADSIALFKRGNAFLVPTMAVHDNIEKDIKTATGAMHDVMSNFLDKHGPRIIAAYRAGVTIAAGSDAGVVTHGKNARELEYYVKEGIPAREAIKAATVNAAQLIGRTNDLGTLEPGKIADIIAVQRDPLADITALQDVGFVMKDGKVYRNNDAGAPKP